MMNKDQRLRNIFYLLLSIIVAAGIWYYVDESSGRIVFQTVWDIPIEYTGEATLADNGLMLVEGDDSGTSTTVDITYRGHPAAYCAAGPLQGAGNGRPIRHYLRRCADGEYHTLLYGPGVQPVQYRH